MVVVVEHFFKWTAVNHGLIALETFALFAFKRLDRDGAKFNSLHSAPRLRIAFQDLNSVEPRILERSEKAFLSERARNAAAPKLGIVLHFLRHFFITDDVGDNSATAFFENAENFIEELPLGFRLDQIEHTAGHDYIN